MMTFTDIKMFISIMELYSMFKYNEKPSSFSFLNSKCIWFHFSSGDELIKVNDITDYLNGLREFNLDMIMWWGEFTNDVGTAIKE